MADTYFAEYTKELVPSFLLIKVGLGQTILGVIAGSLLTMITITFSTIMVVLTTYSSQFSPRTLPNFVTNRTTMRVLGIFMGGFVYSIFSLLFMREDYSQNVISATVGVVVAFICLSFFAYFIHHVATSIQVSNLIEELAEDTIQAMNENERSVSADITFEKPDLKVNSLIMTHVRSQSIGYIQYIDYSKMEAAAEQHDLVIEVNQPIGAFVTPSKPLLTIYRNNDEVNLDTDSFIQVGKERTTLQDVEFGLQKIVEITLRAISPGINDPNTAVACILRLGTILAKICKEDGSHLIFRNKKGRVRLIGRHHSVEQLLYSTFYQICHYGRKDISILLAVYDAIILVAEENADNVKQKALAFSQYVEKAFDHSVLQALDFERVVEKKRQLMAAASQHTSESEG
ncbi:putative membrane protein [Paenibacillus sp. PastM-3]|nr:putative membrane protein [Paenibacillus sp. PastM-3]